MTLFHTGGLPASARIRTTFIGDGLTGTDGLEIDPDGDGMPGGTVAVDFETVTLTTLDTTSVSGRIFVSALASGDDGEPTNVPLPGVTITVDGMEDTLKAVTDDMGNFRLQPAPAGRFFVHIDGKTATMDIPEGAYFPTVGKAWESVVGQDTSVGEIYLPMIPPYTLRDASMTDDTFLTFSEEFVDANPQFRGVAVTIPADSLFAEDGTRGGRVGIAPVPPDRLPGALPEGLEIQDVVTIQTEGASNFDAPVPVCLPNLPDPETGELLPPGAKSALWSFNHDSGRFEIVGSMTVNEDGTLVCTDPGVGILAPGWHGSLPGTSGRARVPRIVAAPPPPPNCPPNTNVDYANALYKAGRGAWPCLKDFIPIGDSVKCGLEIFALVPDLLVKVQELKAIADKDPKEVATALNLLFQTMKFTKDRIVTLHSCFDAIGKTLPTPDKLATFSTCLKAITGPLEQLCAIYSNPTWPKECLDPTTDQACRALEGFNALHAEAEQLIGLTKKLQDEFVITVICQVFNKIETLIKIVTATPTSQGAQPLSQDDSIEELRAEIEALGVELEKLREFGDTLNRLNNLSEGYLQQAQVLSTLSGQAITGVAGPVTRPVYYMIDIEGRVARGQTSSQGTLNRNLTPDAVYFFAQYDPVSNTYGDNSGRTRGNGQITDLGSVLLEPALLFPDSDGDGLVDPAEFVVGTNPDDPDSDDDGVNDLAEVQQGTNPLDGQIANTGIIASVSTRGPALDIDALDDIAAVATGAPGIAVFNVFNGMNPVAVAQVNTPGSAEAVACDGRFVAVADGPKGLAIIDISDPPASRIIHQAAIGGEVRAVEAAAGIAFIGTNQGLLASVDMASGSVITSSQLGGVVQDIRLDGDHLFILTSDRLHIVPINDPALRPISSIEVSGSIPRGTNRRRLFVGDGFAQAIHTGGFVTIDVNKLESPAIVSDPDFAQSGWKHITLNGSGLGIATMSLIPGLRSTSNVFVFDVSDPANPDVFLEEFQTPGAARSIAVFNGLAYVADHDAGLQVVNYLEQDRAGIPPTLSMTTNAAGGSSEEGRIFRASVNAGDDVQVRNVEFYVDGEKVSTDGSFPFDLRRTTPLLADQSSFTVRARVSDTGGNTTWSDEITIAITPDATPPAIVGISPGEDARVGGLEAIAATFSEPIAETTVHAGSLVLSGAGPDEEFGTGDDFTVSGGTLALRGEGRLLLRTHADDLPYGRYRITIPATLTDLAGNPLEAPFESFFELRELPVIALAGTPADPFQASANTGQRFTITHESIGVGSSVSFPVINSGGTRSSVVIALENIPPIGGSGEVVIPADATTGDVVLPDESKFFLQIVPTVTAIEGGGPGRLATIRGTGFAEGATSARFGAASVVDGGPFTNDGINVWDGDTRNDGLSVNVPLNGDLPYEVITTGGSSGRAGDITGVISTSTTGTPADTRQASANVGQTVTLEGGDFVDGVTMITLETIDSGGTPEIQTIAPDTVAADGSSMTFTIPDGASTASVAILGGGSGHLLQIVPTVTSISGGRGRFTTIMGSGFIEGGVTVRAGGAEIVDSGPFTNDGVNVYDTATRNSGMQLNIPDDARLPYEIVTEGGSSGRATVPLTSNAVSQTGTPTNPALPSANVGQQVTLFGAGFATDVTRITLDAIDSGGTPQITIIEPDSVATDGRSLAFTVPPEVRTGLVSVLNGGTGIQLQIVPSVTGIDGGQGRFTTISGTGFTEGFISFVGGPAQVIDAGPFTNDGINVYAGTFANDTLQLTIPIEAELPYQIVTEGGVSGRETDVVAVNALSQTGTPAIPAEASANVGQQVTLLGSDFGSSTMITLEAMDSNGTPFITTFAPDNVSEGGNSLTFTVPPEARTGIGTVIDGGSGFLLQIVPRVTAIDGGRGRFSTISGSGFIEGFISFVGGPAGVDDAGPFTTDGMNVYGSNSTNDRTQLTIPADASLPYQIVTEGGSSGRVTDVTAVNSISQSGTPADTGAASANIGQIVTLIGSGFSVESTMITLEAMDGNGTPFITTFRSGHLTCAL